MNVPTPSNQLATNPVATAAEIHKQRSAHLMAAKAAVSEALRKLGIDRIEAAITNAPAAPCIGPITAFTHTNDIRDLSETKPLTFAWGKDQRTYANLPAFVTDYLLSQLTHDADPFLIDGQLAMETHYGASSPPIDWNTKFKAENEEHLDVLREKKTHLMAALKGLGVVVVEAEYDGEGDSGQINDIYAYKADHTSVPLAATAPFTLGEGAKAERFNTLHECIDEFAWDVLRHHHEGFENNDGGLGKVVIDIEMGKVRLEHNWRISDFEYQETEI